ncbi:hypothetical protein T439DRAFT_329534 [Meredithblackwellia eburnea MCA 4105]
MDEPELEWPIDYIPTWYGFPGGSGSCSSVKALCQSSLVIRDEDVLLPATPGKESRRPSLSFLITHQPAAASKPTTILFDLGIAQCWKSHVEDPALAEIYDTKFRPNVECELDELLREGGVQPAHVDLVILSHSHWDHLGDPSLFQYAKFLVGPSELESMPVLRTNPRVEVIDWESATFNTGPSASFKETYDVFGDGAVVIVNARGHTPGSLGLLLRTTPPSTYIPSGEEKGKQSQEAGSAKPPWKLPVGPSQRTAPPADTYLLLLSDSFHHHLLQVPSSLNSPYRLGAPLIPGTNKRRSLFYYDYPEAGRVVQRMRVVEGRNDAMVIFGHSQWAWERWGMKMWRGVKEIGEWWKEGLALQETPCEVGTYKRPSL